MIKKIQVEESVLDNSNGYFDNVALSLGDIAGEDYIEAVVEARCALTGEDAASLLDMANEKVEFLSEAFQARLQALLSQVGQSLCAKGLPSSARGASTHKFNEATQVNMAPLSGLGYFRIGEDGRLYLTAKSEHYHAPLGHGFPGYRLIDSARRLGIPNATHNNTRGHLTRRLEEELVCTANGITPGDRESLEGVLAQNRPDVMNRVLNLETGSLAVEAALKMMLCRFYAIDETFEPPKYQGRTPVFLVMGNDEGALMANYHGTTILTQVLREMWPELAQKLDDASIMHIHPIRPNRPEDLQAAFEKYEQGPFKIAGFFHEIVMMNYGGRLLSRDFLHQAHDLCRQHDVPVLVDEIQSCIWSPELLLYREYGLTPTFVAMGKGFPGGEYPASRLLFSSVMDIMPQFGALVTNGQEELAAIAYLVTMRWAKANGKKTCQLGEYFQSRLEEMARRHEDLVVGTDGLRHMTTIVFRDIDAARFFTAQLTRGGIDISVQTYKSQCPPVVLTKLPLIADRMMIDYVADAMAQAMKATSEQNIENVKL